jgi:hypothetical protein
VPDDVDAGAGAAAALVTALRSCWKGAKLEIDGTPAVLLALRLLQTGASALGVKGRGAATLRLHPALLAICCCCIIVAIAASCLDVVKWSGRMLSNVSWSLLVDLVHVLLPR